MKQLKVKVMAMVLAMILVALIVPVNVFAAETEMQVVKMENEDYIIYVKDLANTEFKFAITKEKNAVEGDLNYIKSKPDEEGNQVALIEKAKVEEGGDYYIYIKKDTETPKMNQVDFSQAFDTTKMKEVETTTNRIKTELLTNLEKRNEEVNGIKYTETVGGLKIVDEDTAEYFYERTKLPKEKYSELRELAEKLNKEYKEKEMYSKIEFAKEFYTLYHELIDQAQWTEVENNEIKQPIEAQKDEQYIVFIKKEAQNGEITYDAKFMTSYREDEEEKIPGRIETKVTQETTKLPITGDSIALFVILAVVVIALILIFVRMKKLQDKERKQ